VRSRRPASHRGFCEGWRRASLAFPWERFTQQVDQRLFTTLGHGEQVDLGDDTGVSTNDRHVTSLRKHSRPTAWIARSPNKRAKRPAQPPQLLVAGSPCDDSELPEGRERAYRCRSGRFPAKFVWTILFRGTRQECAAVEKKYRPDRGIGWNTDLGGGRWRNPKIEG
jgi:hypothetical protein